MPKALNEASLRHLGTLFGGGSGLGMSDGQLLERFAARDGPRSERAFVVLVERHGPMVQRVARSIVKDRDLADDTFQAVFLALARRARSLWVRDSIGPWLHAVTVRVATRMRADQSRRRRIDERAATLAARSVEPRMPDDLGAALHEEIARLGDRHRLPIVLCLVEGLTHDQAARQLGWPVGTVRSRLARGRDRLRSRLERRGLSPSSGLLLGPGLLARSGSEAIRGSLLTATVQSAVSATQGGLVALVGTVPAGAIAAAVSLVKESSMIHRVAMIGLVGAGVFVAGATLPAQSKPGSNSVAESPEPARSTIQDVEIVSRVYNVASLVVSPAKMIQEISPDGTVIDRSTDRPVSLAPLIDLLTSTISPGTWQIGSSAGDLSDTGPPETGPIPIGSIIPVKNRFHLIIRHTPEVHDEVVERLQQLRLIVGPHIGIYHDEAVRAVRERIIGSELTDAEVVEERIVGPEQFPLEVAPIGEIPARKGRGSDPFSDHFTNAGPNPDRSNPFDLPSTNTGPNPDQRIESLERKLDAILDELRAIRKTDE